jgi:ABC-type transport system involved in cytochrome bd biosynthesis fused ATPase/permease subunit
VQDPYLFRDSIRRNLLWANPQATEVEIWAALAIAEADEFVARLKEGLEPARSTSRPNTKSSSACSISIRGRSS